jgi:hypothetical protein
LTLPVVEPAIAGRNRGHSAAIIDAVKRLTVAA